MSRYLTKVAMVAMMALAAACGGGGSSGDNNGGSNGGDTTPDYKGMLSVTASSYGTAADAVEVAAGAFSVKDKTTYVITITAASSVEGQTVKLKVSHNTDYTEYFSTTCTLKKTPTTCTGEATAAGSTDGAARLIIDVGNNAADSFFYFKDASVTEKGSTTNLLPAAAAPMNDASVWGSWANGGGTPTLAVVQ